MVVLIMSSIKQQLRKIQRRIAKAASKVGRDPAEVRIIVVTRNRSIPEIRKVVEAGCRLLGENRVQEAVEKMSFFEPDIEWHLIGHLQSVKVKAAIRSFSLIHTVDGLRIGFDLQRACEKLNREANILIQVNTTGADAQFGVEPSETIHLIRELVKFPCVKIRGLMTEFPPFDDPKEARPYFRKLRQLRDSLRQEAIEGVDLKWLSVGTSSDYVVAVEEGANLLRITSPIFPEE